MTILNSKTAVVMVAGALAVALASSPVSANMILANSNIDFVGGVNPLPNGSSVFSSTGLDFLSSGAQGTADGTINVTLTDAGSFAAFNSKLSPCPAASAGGCGTIADLAIGSYDLSLGKGVNQLSSPVNNFLTFTDKLAGLYASFNLESLYVWSDACLSG